MPESVFEITIITKANRRKTVRIRGKKKDIEESCHMAKHFGEELIFRKCLDGTTAVFPKGTVKQYTVRVVPE